MEVVVTSGQVTKHASCRYFVVVGLHLRWHHACRRTCRPGYGGCAARALLAVIPDVRLHVNLPPSVPRGRTASPRELPFATAAGEGSIGYFAGLEPSNLR